MLNILYDYFKAKIIWNIPLSQPSKLREGPLTEDGSAFNATNAFAMCPQSLGPSFDSFEPLIPDEVIGQMANLGSENCLKLNIRTPDVSCFSIANQN